MLGKCANPNCGSEFKRLGTGRIYTLLVRNPRMWGLPENVRQKVVWLCGKCDYHKKIRFDQERCEVLVVNRQEHLRKTA